MHNKKKKLAEKRSASKFYRRTSNEVLNQLINDPKYIDEHDGDLLILNPWWEGKKIKLSEVSKIDR